RAGPAGSRSALNISAPRNVRRLADDGKMPPPLKLGALRKWPRDVVASWIASGCPKVEGRP
ncbi:MAG: hypothetical protein ACP5I8_17530, partial [Phycisphaerae bacterium]